MASQIKAGRRFCLPRRQAGVSALAERLFQPPTNVRFSKCFLGNKGDCLTESTANCDSYQVTLRRRPLCENFQAIFPPETPTAKPASSMQVAGRSGFEYESRMFREPSRRY